MVTFNKNLATIDFSELSKNVELIELLEALNFTFLVLHIKDNNFFLTATRLNGEVLKSISSGMLIKAKKKSRDKTTRDIAIDLGRHFGNFLKENGIPSVYCHFKSNIQNNRIICILEGIIKSGLICYGYNALQKHSHNGLRFKKRRRM